jgi:nitroreductase
MTNRQPRPEGIFAHERIPMTTSSVSAGSIADTIRRRFSCRTYLDRPLSTEDRQRLTGFMAALAVGPLGSPARFRLTAAVDDDADSLRGLGTYGFIKGARAYLIGAAPPAPKNLEDFGYLMERLVLLATQMNLGTCWLGGTFTRSRFAQKIQAADDEIIPAVSPIGYIADPARARNSELRRRIGSEQRLPWEQIFFQGPSGQPLTREQAGEFALPLDMLRLAPSASNKQPWRVIKGDGAWHFYLQRTRGYSSGIAARLLKLPDLQRVDMGIAMCHFALTAAELGLGGQWMVSPASVAGALPQGDASSEYTASWMP